MRRELRRILAEDGEADPEEAVEEFLQAVRLDSSLLLERGHKQYGFFHLSFQEYLAAVSLARRIWKGPEAVAVARNLTTNGVEGEVKTAWTKASSPPPL